MSVRMECGRCGGRGYVLYDGDLMRHRRERAGLTLREFAKCAKMAPPYISDVELNRRRVTDRLRAVYDKVCP